MSGPQTLSFWGVKMTDIAVLLRTFFFPSDFWDWSSSLELCIPCLWVIRPEFRTTLQNPLSTCSQFLMALSLAARSSSSASSSVSSFTCCCCCCCCAIRVRGAADIWDNDSPATSVRICINSTISSVSARMIRKALHWVLVGNAWRLIVASW